MSSNKYIIDTVHNIEIDSSKYPNEFQALFNLKVGLIGLYESVKPHEVYILENTEYQEITFFGNPSGNLVPEHLFQMLPNFYHWFGNSLVNYSRLSGFIVGREKGEITDEDLSFEPERKKIKKYCTTYVKSLPELTEILKWRNKVSAHFALTDPLGEDNIATMQSSINFPIVFQNKRFRTTGGMIFGISNAEIAHESEIPDWSLTETFELIAKRFWPDLQFTL